MTKPRPFGHYFILEKIAQGGMAEIFKGLTYDFSGLKKFIVIKRILPHIAANKDFIRMLIDEAKIAVRLSHGNIAQTFDLGKVADDFFIVMEYVEGKTISQIFKKTTELKEFIPVPMAVYFISELSHGLDYIHRRSDESGRPLEIVHRDISPQNVIVAHSGNVKIVDFGVAKAAWKLSEMESGILKGKFAYMSPEQTEGLPIDHRSDIFSTGVVLWEILTGRRLFKKKSNPETIEAVQSQTVYPPSAYRNEIPSELDEIVMKSLERNPDTRYENAAELALALTKFSLKHHSEFKPLQIGDYLTRIFEDDDRTGDLYHEKTTREEMTVRDGKRELVAVEEAEDYLTAAEDTMIVDPQELDFHSIFEEIDVEEGSDITRSIALIKEKESSDVALSRKDIGPEEEEITGDIPLEAPPLKPAPVPGIKDESKPLIPPRVSIGVGILLAILLAIFIQRNWYSNEPARLIVQVDPAEALISVDGKPIEGHSPFLVKDLTPRKSYHVTAALEGYATAEQEVMVRGGKTEQLKLKLAVHNVSKIQINSRPTGAAIFLDGKATGKVTPDSLELAGLKFPLTLGLSRGGAPEWEQRIEKPPAPGQAYFGDLELSYGLLSVESSPAGAKVIVGDKEIGKTPLKDVPITADQETPLVIQLKGFAEFNTSFKVKAGEKEKIYHAMQKEPSR